MVEGVSVPSLTCLGLGCSWQIIGSFLCRFCDVCGVSGTRNERKKRCQESLEIIKNCAWKVAKIMKNKPRGVSGVSWAALGFRTAKWEDRL